MKHSGVNLPWILTNSVITVPQRSLTMFQQSNLQISNPDHVNELGKCTLSDSSPTLVNSFSL